MPVTEAKKPPRVSAGGTFKGWICKPGGCVYGRTLFPGDHRPA